jgi:hypothetical protein
VWKTEEIVGEGRRVYFLSIVVESPKYERAAWWVYVAMGPRKATVV